MNIMLGHVRRTTRTDVALALLMVGITYLAWALSCWMAQKTALFLRDSAVPAFQPPLTAAFLAAFGAWPRLIFDVLGPVWMLAGLYMVIRASRQHRVISWSWLLASCQGLAALLIAAWAQTAQWGMTPSGHLPAGEHNPAGTILLIAVAIWVVTLIWLIGEGIRLRGLRVAPAIGDSAKTNAYRK
jgi:hypothetical protein